MMTWKDKTVVFIGVFGPFLAFIAWIVFWNSGSNFLDWTLLLSFFLITALGITMGFHRQFTHPSFKTTRVIRIVLAILGSMATEGPLFSWWARHLKHHKYADKEGDPHSPLDGFFHAHFGFLFTEKKIVQREYIGKSLQDSDLVFINKTFGIWVLIGIALPGLMAWYITGTTHGMLFGMLWGGPVRIFFVHQVTWSINSICHMYGDQPFKLDNQSRNNAWLSIASLGESWHHNHHAFPLSPRHGLGRWQIDLTWLGILFLEKLHLAWDVHERVPTSEAMDLKRKVFVL